MADGGMMRRLAEAVLNKERIEGQNVSYFHSLPMALGYVERSTKLLMVMRHPKGGFIVAPPAITEALYKLGYEYTEEQV